MSSRTRHHDRLIQYARLDHDRGLFFDMVDCPHTAVGAPGESLPDQGGAGQRSAALLNGNFNHSHDIRVLLSILRRGAWRNLRVITVLYNPSFASIDRLANRLGMRTGERPSTFVTDTDLENLARTYGETNISGFRHGWMLLKMTTIGFVCVRLGVAP